MKHSQSQTYTGFKDPRVAELNRLKFAREMDIRAQKYVL